jgi:hypothetical protein
MAHADGTADDGATAPLLASSTKSGKPPRRNMYAFACATLASMTTILMGYSTYAIPLNNHLDRSSCSRACVRFDVMVV